MKQLRRPKTFCLILFLSGVSFAASGAPGYRKNSNSQNRPSTGDPFTDCVQKAERAPQVCSPTNANQEGSNYTDAANSDSQNMNSSESANMGINEACSRTSTSAGAAASAVRNIRTQCETELDACKKACDQVAAGSLSEQKRNQYNNAKEVCSDSKKDEFLAVLDRAQGEVGTRQTESDNCKKDSSSAGGGEMPKMPSPQGGGQEQQNACVTNPASASCTQLKEDCSNQTFAASNEVCKGLGAKTKESASERNDADPMAQVGDGTGTTSAGAGSSAGRHSSKGFDSGVSAFGSGSGAGGGGSGGSLGGGSSSDPGYADDPASSSGGSRGGGGGGGGSSSMKVPEGSIGPGDGSYSANGNWIPPGLNKNGLDAEKFRAGLAGRSPSSDPDLRAQLHGPDVIIWKEVNIKYLEKTGSLKP